MDDDDERSTILSAHAALVAEGAIEPLARDEAETRLWLDCELASLVENRFFEPLDPHRTTPETRALWEPRATSEEPLSSPHGHDWYRIPYWIRDRGERAGTIALATSMMGARLVTVSSLYTLPSHRRRGVAGRVLRRAQAAVEAHGWAGLRVPTYWTWQPAVRFYLGLGMWIANWKHSLVFCWRRDLPEHRIEVGEREARLSIVRDGEPVPVLAATREGDRLGWTALRDLQGEETYYHARETFAVALATHGYPLIRSDAAWEERWLSSDCGAPEGLANKIEGWEAWELQSGYQVRTPRIPGLRYPPWDELD
jgi:GNAT superfamily N-acetyltransferase